MSDANTRTSNEAQPGFASRQDTSPTQRAIQRRIMLTLPRLRRIAQAGRELLRRLRGGRHVIDFFHQVDDAYSHLALTAISDLQDRYDVDFRFHLVGQTDRLHAPEPEMLADYARRDCALVAPHYGLDFPPDSDRPSEEAVGRVEAMLAGLTRDLRFREVALEAGKALWAGDDDTLARLEKRVPNASREDVTRALSAGNALRKKRRHYSGGMFWYAGEWYWGVDRLYHLERRLIRYSAAAPGTTTPRFERPTLDPGSRQNPLHDEERVSLEIFPSLRSPYTAMIFDRSMRLAKSVDVPVTLLPVMPMVMRGVPAPAAKGIYIMLDALREAQYLDVPFGNMYDPIGRPVERGFSLFPFARDHGRGAEYLSSFLRAAFAEGRDTGSDEGIRRVVEEAGLDFEEARDALDGESWREELEVNRQTMYEELGIWGVPSYRLRGPEGEPDLCVWGQDRLWLVAAEIRRRLAAAD
jgi:2-hydroxychromene-2-carboxylate isomerase